MQSIKRRYLQKIILSVYTLILFGCSHFIPVYERSYGDKVIKEEEIGSYDGKENTLHIKNSSSFDDEHLVKTMGIFKKSSFYLAETSEIERVVLYPDTVTVRVQLENARYFVVRMNTQGNDLTIVESGIIGRAR